MRQTDPSRGQSPWKRGVREDSQILICPGCQATEDWMADLDRCARCSSVRLVRRLGEVECRECGAVVEPDGDGPAPGRWAGRESLGDAGASPGLSEEVAQALDRVLGRSLVSQSTVHQSTMRPSGAGQGPGGPVRQGPGGQRYRSAHPGSGHPGAGHQEPVKPGAVTG